MMIKSWASQLLYLIILIVLNRLDNSAKMADIKQLS